MKKLSEVEDAKALMNVAKDWGIWRWLLEKGRVRATADRAVDALGELEARVKASWSDDQRRAYRELEAHASRDGNARGRRQYERAREEAKDVDPEIKLAVQRVKEADDAAYNARMDAEDTFDEAERRLSAALARQGAEKAIASWDLKEKAIRRAEMLARRK
jgi:hypothetical protein